MSKNLANQIQLFFLICDQSHLVTTFPGLVRPDSYREGMDRLRKAECELSYLCDKIAIETARNNKNTDNLADIVKNIGSVFHDIVEKMLEVEIAECLDRLEECLGIVDSLAGGGDSMCRILVKKGAIIKIVKMMQREKLGSRDRIRVLKTIASLCCISQAIRELAETGGLDNVIAMVTKDTEVVEEEEIREAVGVIAQVTTPWVEDNICKDKIGKYVKPIANSLKGKKIKLLNKRNIRIFKYLSIDTL